MAKGRHVLYVCVMAKPMHLVVVPLGTVRATPMCGKWGGSEHWASEPRVVTCEACLEEHRRRMGMGGSRSPAIGTDGLRG